MAKRRNKVLEETLRGDQANYLYKKVRDRVLLQYGGDIPLEVEVNKKKELDEVVSVLKDHVKFFKDMNKPTNSQRKAKDDLEDLLSNIEEDIEKDNNGHRN